MPGLYLCGCCRSTASCPYNINPPVRVICRAWDVLHGLGMPVFLDRAYPYHDRYANGPSIPGLMNREFDVQKHWWGYKMTELGFQVACTSGWAVCFWSCGWKPMRAW